MFPFDTNLGQVGVNMGIHLKISAAFASIFMTDRTETEILLFEKVQRLPRYLLPLKSLKYRKVIKEFIQQAYNQHVAFEFTERSSLIGKYRHSFYILSIKQEKSQYLALCNRLASF